MWVKPDRDDNERLAGRVIGQSWDTVLAELRKGGDRKLTGLVYEGKGVVRHDFPVRTNAGEGVVTSGVFSPTLEMSIALVRVPKAAQGDCEVGIRGKWMPARLVRPPFVRHGQRVF